MTRSWDVATMLGVSIELPDNSPTITGQVMVVENLPAAGDAVKLGWAAQTGGGAGVPTPTKENQIIKSVPAGSGTFAWQSSDNLDLGRY